MKIEPCPFCGSEVSIGDFERISCPACCYRGGVLMDSNAQHNRLSRIVRAAEKWAKAVRFEAEATSGKRCVPSKIQLDAQDWVTEAEDALLVAVEGGRSDGWRGLSVFPNG